MVSTGCRKRGVPMGIRELFGGKQRLRAQQEREVEERLARIRSEHTAAVEQAQSRIAQVDPSALAAGRPHLVARWRSGVVVSAMITRELDASRFDGPWVDRALGVEEPYIDHVERGLIYPSWDVICRLAAMVDKDVEYFLPAQRTPAHPFSRFGRLGRFGCNPDPTSVALAYAYHPAIVGATVLHGGAEGFADELTAAHTIALIDARARGEELIRSVLDDIDPT